MHACCAAATKSPAAQTYEDLDASLRFEEGDLDVVLGRAAEYFRDARTLAQQLARRGDLMAAAAAADEGPEKGGSTTQGKCPSPRVTGGGTRRRDDSGREARGGVVDGGGAEAVEKAELLALAKVAVSNMLVVMQVANRLNAATRGGGQTSVPREGVEGGKAGPAVSAKGAKRRGTGAGRDRRDGDAYGDASLPSAARLDGRARVEFRINGQFPVIAVSFGGP